MTTIALELLKVIKENNRITPGEMGNILTYSPQYIRNTLRILGELKLVKTPVRGSYMITNLGEYVMKHQDRFDQLID
ncbi:hypothetical protein ES702_00554 [subsurface metagenome]